jgi:hypothetical protein
MLYENAAQRAVEYVKLRLTVGANNRLADIWRTFGGSLTCVAGEKAAELVMRDMLNRMDPLETIRTIAKMAENRKCGNCGEQSCVAFLYLFNHKVRPIDLMAFSNGDHGYVDSSAAILKLNYFNNPATVTSGMLRPSRNLLRLRKSWILQQRGRIKSRRSHAARLL